MSDVDAIVAFIQRHAAADERVASEVGELDATARNGIESTAGYSALQVVEHFNADRLLADVVAKRALVVEVMSWLHFYLDEDGWYSCSQAVDPSERHAEPGSGCLDDERRGKPCDCGLDRRRMRILVPAAAVYHGHDGWRDEWEQR